MQSLTTHPNRWNCRPTGRDKRPSTSSCRRDSPAASLVSDRTVLAPTSHPPL